MIQPCQFQTSFGRESIGGHHLECGTCVHSLSLAVTHFDLTIGRGTNKGESMPAVTEIFRTRLVPFLYERGWRKGLSVLLGFPGPEKEFELIKDFRHQS